MKNLFKLGFLYGLLGATLAYSQSADTYQKAVQITSTGYSLHNVDDVINDGTNFIGLCEADSGTRRGFDIVKTDLNAGNSLAGKVYMHNTTTYTVTGQRILSISGNYYVMANYSTPSAASGTAFIKISASTGAVTFSEHVSSFHCGTPAYQPIDMVYDGSAYIYMLGQISNTASMDLWVAKFDLSGSLQYMKQLVNNNYDEFAQNIYYQNDTAIYIGGISDSVTAIKHKGLMVKIDNNANVLLSKTITYLHAGNPRISTFNLIRNSNNLYAVASAYIGADGIGPLLVEKLDLTMNDVSHTFYNYTNSGTSNMWFLGGQSEIFINHSHLVVPLVDRDANVLVSRGYLNAFFNLSTTFLNANVLNKSHPALTNGYYSICTAPYPVSTNGYMFSFEANTNVSNGVYYTKGTQDFDYTLSNTAPCDTTYPLVTETATLVIASYTLSTSTQSVGVCSYTTDVKSPSYTFTTNCFNCANCRTQEETAAAGAFNFTDHVEVMPNPSTGKFNVQLSLPEATEVVFVVMNQLGETVYQRTEHAISKGVVSHDLTGLSKGVYFMHIYDSTGNKAVKRILIE